MPYKEFMLDEHLPVTIYKRKASRRLRLSITPKGQVRVSIPSWAPYRSGLEFARSRQDWIQAQRPAVKMLSPGQSIGKAHRLEFVLSDRHNSVKSRLLTNQVLVHHPARLSQESEEVQRAAETASIRALRVQAEKLLPQRLEQLAAVNGYSYASVRIKRLKSRWGSCDQHQNIVLNLFLMQLPWHLIDYVLLHELAHTKLLRHGPDFWREMEVLLPNVKEVRKELKAYQPVLS